MKRAAIAVSICLGLASQPARALDWSLGTTQSETVELNNNLFLKTPPSGVIGSYSLLSADAEARTSTSKFDFDADGSYRKNWGPGVDGITSEFINYGFKTRYEQKEKTPFDREFVETRWRQQSTAFALLSDLGIATTVRGFIDRLTFSGGIDRSITARDSFNLFATSTQTSYEPSTGGTAFTDTDGVGSWRHDLTSRAALNLSSNAELLDFDNMFNTRVQIYRNKIGADVTVSPLLSVRGNIGSAHVATQRGLPTTPAIGPTTPISSTTNDWIGDAVLTYKVFADTTFAFNAEQSIAPSIVGTLFKRDSLTATLNYTINSHSTLAFSANAYRQIATTTTDFASASVSYGYTFTREWNAQLSYRYLHRFASTGTAIVDPITGFPTVSGTGPADSHSLLLVVSHSYLVLPPGN